MMDWKFPASSPDGSGRQILHMLRLNSVFHRWLHWRNGLLVAHNGRLLVLVRDGAFGSDELRDGLAAAGVEAVAWPLSEAAMVAVLENGHAQE